MYFWHIENIIHSMHVAMLMMYFLFIIQIWLTGVQCNGSENSIFDCTHQPWGNTGCTEANDAGVICTSMLIIIHAHSLCV